MKTTFIALLAAVIESVRSRGAMQLEILALRHQLAVYQRTSRRPRLTPSDRLIWGWLASVWSGWRDVLVFVKPETVVAWQRKRFRDHWTRPSRQGKPGRPQVPREVLVLAHDRRRVLHWGVTEHPTARWTAQQMVEAFPWDEAPRFLVRDRDSIYGGEFRRRIRNMGIEEVLIALRSPWQNPFVERLIGSIRRECLDHVVVFSGGHLRRLLSNYFAYYHRSRIHQGLEMDCPQPRRVQQPELGHVVAIPQVGGLHHRYQRRAA